VALLPSVELVEECGGEVDILIDSSDGGGSGGSLVGQCREVVGRIGVLRHPLSMVDAEGVSAKGSVGLLMVEGLGLLSALAVLPFLG